MKKMFPVLLGLWMALTMAAAQAAARVEPGFKSLFDGKTLKGWTMMGTKGDGYVVKDGMIVCTKGTVGNLLTEREYEDFVLRFEFRVEAGSNNGIGIRTPMMGGSVAYEGVEIQILEDTAPQYANLKPWQYHGAVYGIVAPKRGASKPVGEWNVQEIRCEGRKIKVKVNGKTIVDADLNTITDPEILNLHPGMLRDRGHIALLGHTDHVEFRNLRVKELPRVHVLNRAPEGFKPLFNGRDLAGWQGLNGDPVKRAKMSIDEWAKAQVKADELMQQNWLVTKGVITYRGNGFDNLCTEHSQGNFELLLDWRTPTSGDSGVYLRGVPQVQIWGDPVGSGGLFNNKTNASKPLVRADRYEGTWNRFRILMLDDKVTVFLNDQIVTYGKKEGIALENYWEPGKPAYSWGPIELQAHKEPVQFRNIFIRPIR